jgi:hypothetical protein
MFKVIVFRNVTPCSLVDNYEAFGGNFYILIQGRRRKGHENSGTEKGKRRSGSEEF